MNRQQRIWSRASQSAAALLGGQLTRRRSRLLDLLCLALLGVVVGAFFWPLLVGGYWIPRGGGDLVSFLWPTYRFAARSLWAGVIPLWNPHLYGGAPFVADNQSGVFYPVNLLAFLLFGEPNYAVMEGLAIFHIWLAGAGTFALARGLGLRRPAALFAGVAFALSDLFVTHIGNLNLNATAAWLPWLVLLTHRALGRGDHGECDHKGRPYKAVATAGVVLAVAALAGHGQMVLYVGMALAAYVGYRLVVEGGRRVVGMGLRAAAIVAIGVGGAALALLPAWEMAGHTGRGHLTYEEATRYSLPPQALVGLVAPGFYGRGVAGFWGDWDRVEVGYAGVATLLLATVGAGRWASGKWQVASGKWRGDKGTRRQGERERGREGERETRGRGDKRTGRREEKTFPGGFFVLLVAGGLVLAMGRHTPVYGVLYQYVPTFDQVRAPARLIVLVDLGLALLAAYGLNGLLGKTRPGRAPAWIGLGAAAGGAALLAVGLWQAQTAVPAGRVAQATASVAIAAALLAAGGLLTWLTGRRGRVRPWTHHLAAWLLVGLLAADLVGLGSTLEIEPNDPTLGFGHEDVVAFLRQDPGLFRIEAAARAWQPDAALAHGLYDIGGVFNPLGLAPYHAYRWAVGERGAPLYNLLGVKYVLADKGKPPGDERLVPVYAGNPEMDVYLNKEALPRALLVHEAWVVADHAGAWAAVHEAGFDPEKVVVLEEESEEASQRESELARERVSGSANQQMGERITFVRYELNEVAVAVETGTTGWLVLSDAYYPGWQATVDREAAEVLRANYTFRAVRVEPGAHVVRMWFTPWTWQVGAAVSAATWAGLGMWTAWTFLARRRKIRKGVPTR